VQDGPQQRRAGPGRGQDEDRFDQEPALPGRRYAPRPVTGRPVDLNPDRMSKGRVKSSGGIPKTSGGMPKDRFRCALPGHGRRVYIWQRPAIRLLKRVHWASLIGRRLILTPYAAIDLAYHANPFLAQ